MKSDTTKKTTAEKMLANGETDTISHKRFIAIVSLIMLCLLALLSCFGFQPMVVFVYVFGVLTGGESFLTVVEKVKGVG